MDVNTAERRILLSECNRKATLVPAEQPYRPHPERFEQWRQVLGTEGLTVRCYWEVQWSRVVHVGVTYKEIRREEQNDHSRLGWNNKSWILNCSKPTAWHNGKGFALLAVPNCTRDWGCTRTGRLEFYPSTTSTPAGSKWVTFSRSTSHLQSPSTQRFGWGGHNSSALFCKVSPVYQVHYRRKSIIKA
jgi:hypothetical protein